ncbi:hypothetical protein J4408_02870 [Candidatus Pacearchaeota archaeon]|nr:hypothetical protein [Candidatus Pacearchaeota archaeon]
MKKETFHKKWYYQLLQVIFLGFFIFFIIVGIRGIFYGEGELFVGFIFAGILAIVYWLIMRNKGTIGGFIFGVIVSLLLIFIISKLNPGDDIAGIVIITLLLSGLFFAFVGHLIKNYFGKKNKKMKKYTFRNYIEYMKDNPKGYWFKRKLYGWGWIPVKWQGWLVVVISLAIFIASLYLGETDDAPGAVLIGFLLMIAIIFAFGYWKGEKPKWGWGR